MASSTSCLAGCVQKLCGGDANSSKDSPADTSAGADMSYISSLYTAPEVLEQQTQEEVREKTAATTQRIDEATLASGVISALSDKPSGPATSVHDVERQEALDYMEQLLAVKPKKQNT